MNNYDAKSVKQTERERGVRWFVIFTWCENGTLFECCQQTLYGVAFAWQSRCPGAGFGGSIKTHGKRCTMHNAHRVTFKKRYHEIQQQHRQSDRWRYVLFCHFRIGVFFFKFCSHQTFNTDMPKCRPNNRNYSF